LYTEAREDRRNIKNPTKREKDGKGSWWIDEIDGQRRDGNEREGTRTRKGEGGEKDRKKWKKKMKEKGKGKGQRGEGEDWEGRKGGKEGRRLLLGREFFLIEYSRNLLSR
jgi:hypothetical protein